MYGFPQVDYIIRMIPISEKEIDDMIVNFQKSQIWQEKRLDFVSQWLEIDLIDHDMKDHIQKQETYEEVQQSIKHLTFMLQLDSKIQQSRNQKNMYIPLAMEQNKTEQLGNLVQLKINERETDYSHQTDLAIRFQRTIRRLMILRSFAKQVGQEFDIENLEVARLTRRPQVKDDKQDEEKAEAIRLPKQLIEL